MCFTSAAQALRTSAQALQRASHWADPLIQKRHIKHRYRQSLHIRIQSTIVLLEAQPSQASRHARQASIHSFMFFIVLEFK